MKKKTEIEKILKNTGCPSHITGITNSKRQNMNRFIRILTIAAIQYSVIIQSAAAGTLQEPVETKNTHILYISHLFMPAEGSSIDENRFNNAGISIIQSNTIFDMYHFKEHEKEGKFDVETTSLLFHYTRNIDSRTEIKILIPFYYHGRGFMDHSIESFHKAFPGDGLKNGGREYGGDNEIHIRYQVNNGGPDISDPFYGMGDPSLFLKRILYHGNPGITLSMGVKPQTGDKAFINSGTTDFGFTINADYSTGIFYIYAMAGYSYLYGDGIYGEELDQFRSYILSSAMGTGITPVDSIYFSFQFYVHNSLYKTGIERIDYVTLINSYSVRWQMNEQTTFQFSIDEDAITYATADISFSFKGEYSF
jgi:hypothetical protein